MRDAGQNQTLEVAEDALERFTVLRSAGRQGRLDLTGRDAREHGIALGPLEILLDPAFDPSKVLHERLVRPHNEES